MLITGLLLMLGIHSGLTSNVAAMDKIGKFIKVEKTQRTVSIDYESGKAKLQIFKSGIVHLTIERGGNERKSFAVIETPEELSRRNLKADKEKVSINLPDGTVEYFPETMKLTYKSKSNSDILDLNDIQFSDTGLAARFDIHGARNFYGLGEKTLPFNKYGTHCTMWNSDFPAYTVKFDPLYESIPFLLKADTNGAYGLLFDNTFRSTFDVGASDSNQLVYTAAGGAFQLYIITGKDPAEVVERLSELTGKMHMPPIWALGYQQSRWSYYPEDKVIDLAHGFRENKIPCDVIYLDIDYMDGYKCFTWSPKNFPTPRNMLDTLHNLGFKVVTIIDPGIKDEKGYHVYDSGVKQDVFVKMPVEDPARGNGKYFVGKVWPGDCVFPDFLNEKTREWWGKQYEGLLDDGVDGFWNDMNEPSVFNTPNKTFPLDAVHRLDDGTATHAEVHNVYGMQMARGTREGLEKLEPNKRPLVLTRANYAGGQRYAAMWTGDNFASFAHMKLALVMFLNIGVSGQPFVGSDVGGFIGNPSAELFSRWLELGVFSPFYRTHSVKGSAPREPWVFGAKYTRINRQIIDRRYELLPEIYTAFRDANQNGLPIVRPLYLDFPHDKDAYNISDEFLFGDKLLVAPVFDSGAVARKVYLPEGKWASIYDGSEIGSGWHEVNAPLGITPVFVKNGTILFTQSLIQSTTEQADTLVLKLFSQRLEPEAHQPLAEMLLRRNGTKSASGKAYFDDGESLAYKSGHYLNVNVSYEQNGSARVFHFVKQGDFKPGYKYLSVEIMNVNGTPIHRATMKTSDGHKAAGVISSKVNKSIRITFPFSSEIESIHLE
ncbi:MAG: DUF5110 domain-containing protein [Bacteroidetes bacterium]|nr:DUF5110 domain-containing protein [Bacteroidota bacterium]MCL5738418.1 DUF5110 domain-containing protein [Bacteroidota bacterium]